MNTPVLSGCAAHQIAALHDCPMKVERNNFKCKSLSSFACNPCLGCSHGCRFCYVPDTSAKWQKRLLNAYGVDDPSEKWGGYTLVRPLIRQEFIRSILNAEEVPPDELSGDGNRAVMFSSTTDAYQLVRAESAKESKDLTALLLGNVGEALEMILEMTTLNVRILTRSPLARKHFDLFRKFGNRLMFGVSLPTLDERISKLYEPHAPGPGQRLKLLKEAHALGIPTFVAIAPVFPETDYEGLRNVMRAVMEADPLTLFMEPINIRLGIGKLIGDQLRNNGMEPSPVLGDPQKWDVYAITKLREAERAADELGIGDRLHLWPDHDRLGSKEARATIEKGWDHPLGLTYDQWLNWWWERESEWPGKVSAAATMNERMATCGNVEALSGQCPHGDQGMNLPEAMPG